MRIVLIGLLLLAGCDSLDPDISAAEKNVRDHQKDPGATQFRNVVNCKSGRMVTGEVLGKNSYGAYVGWKRFWANQFEVTIEDEDGSAAVGTVEADCDKSPEQWEADFNNNLNAADPADTNAAAVTNGTVAP